MLEDEVGRRFGSRLTIVERHPDRMVVELKGRVDEVLSLRIAVAAYSLRRYPVPRPKALLGDQHLRALLDQIDAARSGASFHGFRFSAAGDASSVFQRLAEAIADHTGLAMDRHDGELLIRVRPTGPAWEVAVRLSPRPLATRPWRVRNYRGALNATIAAAMVELSEPRPDDRFLNLLSGSGTLLIERALRAPAARLVGVELDADVVAIAAENAAAASVDLELLQEDGRSTSLPSASFDAACTDLPYGDALGSHADNEALAVDVLAEAARLVVPGGRLIVITHELQRFRRALAAVPAWALTSERRVFQKGHRPGIWQLTRQ
jgi:tRNA (guanine6-N2)-methyltransferase